MARRVPGEMHDGEAVLAERDDVPVAPGAIGGPGAPLLRGARVERLVGVVQPDRHTGMCAAHRGDTAHVVEVRVREPDGVEREGPRGELAHEALALVTRIDEDGAARDVVGHEEAVGLQRADGERLDAKGHRRQACEASGGGTCSAEATTIASAVSSRGLSPMPWCASQRSASSAAMHPVPALVIACR